MVTAGMRISLVVALQVVLIGCGAESPTEPPDTPLQLHLTANGDGSLKQMTLNGRKMGNDGGSFKQLATQIDQFVTRNEKAEDANLQLDITADQRLRFEFVQRAMSLYVERVDTKTEDWDSRISHIRLINPAANGEIAVPSDFLILVEPRSNTVDGGIIIPNVKVRLTANADGSLKMLTLGRRQLANDNQVFGRLNHEILKIIGKPGHPLTADIAVEIDADGALRFQHVLEAIKACNGRLGRNGWIVYIDNFVFEGVGGTSEQDEVLQELKISNEVEFSNEIEASPKEKKTMPLPPLIEPR
jgi:biopolymer transport protein ExbD